MLEDNATVGGLLVALLREEGYRALRAWDSREAVRIARDRQPDLIVLELSLPYRDGLPILKDLRAQPEMKNAPILVVSGNVLQLASEEEAVITASLTKPVDIDRLVNAMRRALGDPEYEVPPKDYSSTIDQSLHHW